MKPLNLFDATAVPMYDAFDADPSDNAEPYTRSSPRSNLLERNTANAPNARALERLPLEFTDRTPQRMLDRILWQSSTAPTPSRRRPGRTPPASTRHAGSVRGLPSEPS